MGLNIPEGKPGLEQMLSKLSAVMNGELTTAGLPKNVRAVNVEGRVAEFLVTVDFTEQKRLDESIAGLRNLADVLSAGAHLPPT